jgi:hypothetical protein
MIIRCLTILYAGKTSEILFFFDRFCALKYVEKQKNNISQTQVTGNKSKKKLEKKKKKKGKTSSTKNPF